MEAEIGGRERLAWTKMGVAVDFPGNEGAADPSLLQDRDTGTILAGVCLLSGPDKGPGAGKDTLEGADL